MTSQRISGCHGNLPLAVLSEVGLAAGAAWLCFSSFGALSFHSSWAVWGAQREELPDGKGGGVSLFTLSCLWGCMRGCVRVKLSRGRRASRSDSWLLAHGSVSSSKVTC